MGAIEGTVNKNITVFNRLASKEGCNSGQKLPTQRHLFGIKSSSKILTNGRSPSRGIKESKMSVSLKTKIRPKLAKMRSETPEKSEIIRMFEKIVKNRDITDNVNVEINDSKVETGTDLLPDIRSGNATFSRENSTISDDNDIFGRNRPKNPNYKTDFNPRIGGQAVDPDLSLSNVSSGIKVVDQQNVDGCIVGLPNSTSRKTQSDKGMKRKPSRSDKKTVKELREEIESKSMKPITCFFRKKSEKSMQNDNFGESNSTNDN